MFDKLKSYFFGERESSEASIDALARRKRGVETPVSISTAMIFESEDARPDKWNQLVLINLRTLVRNIVGAVDPVDKDLLEVDDIIDTVIEEMGQLKELFQTYKPNTEVDFYYPDYSTLTKGFPKGNIRLPKTKLQEKDTYMHAKIFKRMESRCEDEQDSFTYRQSGWQLEKDDKEVTLVTHCPTDLLSQYKFPKMNLLETHTGRVKVRREWSSKLNKNAHEDVTSIPFCKFTIQVYGEGVFFQVSDTKIKKYVKDMAVRDKWNAMTSDSRIRGSIMKIKNPQDRDILLSYL